MSTADTATISDPQVFEAGASLTAQRALFNPVRTVREHALKQLRAQSVFSAEQWEHMDKAVFGTNEEGELTADSTLQIDSWTDYSGEIRGDQDVPAMTVDRLLSAGFGIPTSLNRYIYVSQMRNVDFEAEVSMNGRSRGRQDMPAIGLDGVPLPIFHADYEIDAREYQNALQFGEPFDASVGTEARRAVNRKEEEVLWDGWGGNIETDRGVFSLDGLDEDNGKVLTGTSAGWSTDAANVLADMKTMIDDLEQQGANNNNGPMPSELGAMMFVPTQQWGIVTRADYETSATDEPIIDRVERKYPYVTLVPAPRLTAGHIIMLVRDTRYFGIANAQGITNTSWEVDGGMALRNKVISSRVPYVKEQPDSIYGIVRYTGAEA